MNPHQRSLRELTQWRAALATAGLAPPQALEELAALLALKLDPLRQADWHRLVAAPAAQRLALYRALPPPGGVAVPAALDDAALFSRLLFGLHQLDWLQIRQHGAAELFETLLEAFSADHPDDPPLGPPQALSASLVGLLQPEPGDTVLDPCAGGGSLLAAADAYVQVVLSDELDQGSKILPTYRLLGVEPRPWQRRLAQLNLHLHQAPAELAAAPSADWPAPSVVCADLSHLPLPRQAETARNAWRGLVPGGRALLLLADELLYQEEWRPLRRNLLQECELHTLLRLPNGISYGQDLALHAVFMCRGRPTEQLWYYDLRSGLPWFDPACKAFEAYYMRDFEAAFGDHPEGRALRKDRGDGGRFRCYSRAEVSAAADSLDPCWLDDETAPPLPGLPRAAPRGGAGRAWLPGAIHELQALRSLLAPPAHRG